MMVQTEKVHWVVMVREAGFCRVVTANDAIAAFMASGADYELKRLTNGGTVIVQRVR